jgi:hypothetical protein
MHALPLRHHGIRCALTILLGVVLACASHPIPAAAARSVTRHFPETGTFTVRVHGRLASVSCAPRVILPRNRLRLSLGGGRRSPSWLVSAGARTLGRAPVRARHGLRLHLDARAGTISAQAGARALRRKLPLKPERAVRVLFRASPDCRTRGIEIIAGRRSAPSPDPTRPGLPSDSTVPPSASESGSRPMPLRPFAPDSVWNQALAAGAPLDTRSDVYVDDLNRQVRQYAPWINTTQYSTPVYTVPIDQPTVRVALDEMAAYLPLLQRAWEQVPIPPDARPAAGTDGQMVVWQPSTDTMWEFWRASRQADGWHARYGGRMEHVSGNPGYFTDPSNWGATATSLPLLGGLIRLDELAAGHIDQALAMAIPETRASCFSWPAQRTDGTVIGEQAIPEGTRFRIDPGLDLSAMPMRPIVRMLAEAAQRYGIVIRDRAGAVTFYAEDPTPIGQNPYAGPSGYFGAGYLDQLLRQEFPWQHLQALRTQVTCR